MADAPTFSDLQRIGRDEALAQNASLSVEAFDRDGADANVMNASAAAMGDEIAAQLLQFLALAFLDSAENEDLDALVMDRYSLVRKGAANAIGSVEFSTTAPTSAAFAIPVNTKLSTSDGRQFVTIAAELFPLASTGPVTVAVRSVIAGASQQARPGTITNIASAIAGSPADLAVTNPLATAGAANAESDASLRNRARGFFLTARRGTLAAIETGALAVAGVEKATAIEVIDTRGRPARIVLLIVTDAYTDTLASLNQYPVTYATQSQALTRAVFAGLSDVRAGGIYVQVQVAQVVLISVTLRLRFKTTEDPDAIATRARAVVVAVTNSYRPGESWEPTDVLAALRTVSGLDYTGDEIDSPAGAIDPTVLQVLRTTMSLVYASSAQADVALATTTNPDVFSGDGT